MSKLTAILDLIRIKATIRLIPLILIGALVGFHNIEFSTIDFLKILIGSFTFIAAGMALNDLLGYKADRKTKAGTEGHYDEVGRLTGKKPIISGDLTVSEAEILTLILMIITTIIAISFPEPRNYYFLLIGALSITLEIVYNWIRYISPAGTLVTASLFGMFPAGGYIATSGIKYEILIPLFILGFFWEISHNILADILDIEGDRIRKLRTIPISFGIRTAENTVMISSILTIIASILLFYSAGLGLIPIIGSILAGSLFLSNFKNPLKWFSNSKNYIFLVFLVILIDFTLKLK